MESLTSNGSVDSPNGRDIATTTTDEPLSPPYWQVRLRSNSALSDASTQKRRSNPIRLEDHTEETSEQFYAVWAKAVKIDDYIIVSGATPGIGSYVVFNITVDTLSGGSMKIRKRYSEFDKLRKNLVKTFPLAGAALPELPLKSIMHRFQHKFLEKRRAGLDHFLNCVILNPEFSGSPVLKEFLFA